MIKEKHLSARFDFLPLFRFHFSISSSISKRSQWEEITGPLEGHLNGFLPRLILMSGFFCAHVFRDACVCIMCFSPMCAGKLVKPNVLITKERRRLPTNPHNLPTNNGFIVEDPPASQMHLRHVCRSNVHVCFHAFRGFHNRTAHHPYTLDLDEGECCSSH